MEKHINVEKFTDFLGVLYTNFECDWKIIDNEDKFRGLYIYNFLGEINNTNLEILNKMLKYFYYKYEYEIFIDVGGVLTIYLHIEEE